MLTRILTGVFSVSTMIMKKRGDKCHPGRGKRGKIPLLPNNVGKKSVNDAGPKQGHNTGHGMNNELLAGI